jgi:hypothetical protein
MNFERLLAAGALRPRTRTTQPSAPETRARLSGRGRGRRRSVAAVTTLVVALLAAGGAPAASAETTLTYTVGVSPCESPQT